MEETKMIDTRFRARDFVFGILFARAFSPDDDANVLYEREIANANVDFGTQSEYVRQVFFGVTENVAALDEKIETAAVAWSLDRLSKASLTIMRLCIYEMLAVEDVPKRVALNEAVRLAQRYDDEKASAFVNGVLNNIAKTLPDKACDQ